MAKETVGRIRNLFREVVFRMIPNIIVQLTLGAYYTTVTLDFVMVLLRARQQPERKLSLII